MKDKLEDFVREKRQEFDMIEPNVSLWDGIDNKMNKSRLKSKMIKMLVVNLPGDFIISAHRYYNIITKTHCFTYRPRLFNKCYFVFIYR